MFMTTGLIAFMIAIKLLIGAGVGFLVSVLIHRSRLTLWRGFKSALIAGAAYLFASGLAGWADAHAAFQNGQRLDVAPWGENLRVRNFIAENELMICLVGATVAAILANLGSRQKAAGAKEQ